MPKNGTLKVPRQGLCYLKGANITIHSPLVRSSARCTLARLTPIDRATDDTDDPDASRFLACSALSPISFAGRPPARPRAFAAATPALVRSRMMARSNSAMLPKI